MAYVHTRIFEYLVCARDRERACVCVRAARRAARRHTHDTHRPRAGRHAHGYPEMATVCLETRRGRHAERRKAMTLLMVRPYTSKTIELYRAERYLPANDR